MELKNVEFAIDTMVLDNPPAGSGTGDAIGVNFCCCSACCGTGGGIDKE